MDVLEAIHRNRAHAPRPAAALVTTGYLLEEPDADYLCTVSVHDSEPIRVPAIPGTYTGVTAVRVLMQGGRPVQALGPAGSLDTDTIPGPPPPSGSTVRTASKVILPTRTGTFRVTRGSWSNWGDPADVYQEGSAESGQLWGLAVYGNQFTDLGASAITRAALTLVQATHTGLSGTWTATVQGSASGTIPAGAPSYAGTTTGLSMPGRSVPGARSVDLPADVRDALRTGSTKGLGLVGSAYGVTLGAGRGDGRAWAVAVDYEVTS